MPRVQGHDEVGVRVPFPGFDLNGDMAVPANARGVVLFAERSRDHQHSLPSQWIARALHEHNLGTLLFDLLTEQEQAEDNFTEHLRFNIELLARRLLRVTRWCHEREPNSSLGYLGSGTASAAALVAAAQSEIPVRAIVSCEGRPDMAGRSLPIVKAPTLLVVGEKDSIGVDLNREAYVQLRCERESRLIPGATDVFERPGVLEQTAEMAAEWFERHINS